MDEGRDIYKCGGGEGISASGIQMRGTYIKLSANTISLFVLPLQAITVNLKESRFLGCIIDNDANEFYFFVLST